MGRTGQTGRPGVRGVKGEPGECSCADSIYAEPYREKRSDKVKPSVTFTMWGSASCPYKSDIIYSGKNYEKLYLIQSFSTTLFCFII